MIAKVLRAALKILGFLGVWTLLLGLVVLGAVSVGGRDWYERLDLRFGVEAGGMLAALAALAVMARLVDKRGWNTLGFAPARAAFGLIAGTALGAGLFALPLLILFALGAARFAPDMGDFSVDALGLGLALCFLNVVHQEALVRSYAFQELWAKFGAWTAAIVTTLLFVALHAAPIMQGLNGLLAGANILLASLMLSLAYVRTRALWLPIGIHFGWNGLQGPVLGVNVTGAEIGLGDWHVLAFEGEALLTGGAMGVEGGLVGLAGPAAGLVLVALLVKQRAA